MGAILSSSAPPVFSGSTGTPPPALLSAGINEYFSVQLFSSAARIVTLYRRPSFVTTVVVSDRFLMR
jgi:hypothetical protein